MIKSILNFNFKSLTFLILGSALLSSCDSNKLTRDKAEDLIKEFYQYPNVEIYLFQQYHMSSLFKREDYSILIPSGVYYCKEEEYNCGFSNFGNFFIVNDYRENPNPYSYTAIITNSRVFNEISGIKLNETNTSAVVEFSCMRKGITPFGEIKGYKVDDIVNYSVNMSLFDDGWRVESKEQIYPTKDFSFFNESGDYIGE